MQVEAQRMTVDPRIFDFRPRGRDRSGRQKSEDEEERTEQFNAGHP